MAFREPKPSLHPLHPDYRGPEAGSQSGLSLEEIERRYFSRTDNKRVGRAERKRREKEDTANSEAFKSLIDTHGEQVVIAQANLIHERTLATLKELKIKIPAYVQDKRWVFVQLAKQKRSAGPKTPHHLLNGPAKEVSTDPIDNEKRLQAIVDWQVGSQWYQQVYEPSPKIGLRQIRLYKEERKIIKELGTKKHSEAETRELVRAVGAFVRKNNETRVKKYTISESDIAATHPKPVEKKPEETPAQKPAETPETPPGIEAPKTIGEVRDHINGRSKELDEKAEKSFGSKIAGWIKRRIEWYNHLGRGWKFLIAAGFFAGAWLAGPGTLAALAIIGGRRALLAAGAFVSAEAFLIGKKKNRKWLSKIGGGVAALATFFGGSLLSEGFSYVDEWTGGWIKEIVIGAASHVKEAVSGAVSHVTENIKSWMLANREPWTKGFKNLIGTTPKMPEKVSGLGHGGHTSVGGSLADSHGHTANTGEHHGHGHGHHHGQERTGNGVVFDVDGYDISQLSDELLNNPKIPAIVKTALLNRYSFQYPGMVPPLHPGEAPIPYHSVKP